ncbi:MBL fold metallo-hydrolase [Sediminibacterium soli]|uniref:MBL fold metallo-hydrolase n=1 Tax=Sediminibacterium soli TaxID=2698829 RepID=UPI00293BBDC8|nr:MBL fold metallo-hydrolase [Sediminibacterium soli]
MSAPPLTITFLGTGTSTGIPMIACPCPVCASADTHDKRLRSSILVSSAHTTLVVDTTPDFRYQMLRTDTRKLDGVVYTHHHKDHIAGMDDVRAFNFINDQVMRIYANALTEEALRRDFYYAFMENKYPGVPELKMIMIDDTPFMVGDIPVQPIQVLHHKLPVMGFRFGDFVYITDANRIEDTEKEKIRGAKILVLNALRREAHISHFTLDEAIELANELAVPEVYFTHISHQLGKHTDINRELPAHIRLAWDGLTLRL